MAAPAQVCILGGGSFGSAMACVIAKGSSLHPATFRAKVRWWVRRPEQCEEINTERTNKKYWPGSLPSGLVATSDVRAAVADADVCFLAVPSAFLAPVLEQLVTCLPRDCVLVSLLKSLKIEDGRVVPYSRFLSASLPGRPVAALMGPNLFSEMARVGGDFAEATLGVRDSACAALLEALLNTPRFGVHHVSDVEAVDLCGCLKNVFTLACGFARGSGFGGNVRAAIIRRALCEMRGLLEECLPDNRPGRVPTDALLLEACGVGDLVLSCTIGRGQQLAADFVSRGWTGTWEELERETLGGMRIPDLQNLQAIRELLVTRGRLDAYPLVAGTWAVAFGGAAPASIVDALRGSGPCAEGAAPTPPPTLGPGHEASSAGGAPSPKRARRFASSDADAGDFDLGLTGYTALVTGASGGIGRHVAAELASRCRKVWAVDRDGAGLAALAAESPRVTALPCDLADLDAVRSAVAAAGEVDFLVNAAGVLMLQAMGEQTVEAWDLTMNVNTRATWFLIQEVSRGMAVRGFGSIVNISSQSSSVAVSPKHLVYSTSKAAVDHITRCAAYALAGSGVRVNALNPTVVRTKLAVEGHGEEGLARMARKVPLGRICETQDVADAVLFLLSRRARMITGVTLPVDGGFLCSRP